MSASFTSAADFFAATDEVLSSDRLRGLDGSVVFEIVDAGSWTVSIADGHHTVTEGDSGSSDARVITDESHFVSIVNGEARARRLFMTGKVKVRGKLAFAISLDKILVGG